jgi:hypothetical protein
MKSETEVRELLRDYAWRLHGLERSKGSPRTKAKLHGIVWALEEVLK